MSDDDPIVHQETRPRDSYSQQHAVIASPHCPFCTIARNFPSIDPLTSASNSAPSWDPEKLSPPSYVLLSTPHVVAFLDIAPLTRGHVLVAPRNHRIKVGDMTPTEMSEVGRVLPLLARALHRAVLPDIPHAEVDYNIVQNNGPGAAQVVPHVHFHIIPRPPLNYSAPSPSGNKQNKIRSRSPSKPSKSNKKSKYPPSELPTGLKRSYIQFGRGARHELDDEDAYVLVEDMRRCIAQVWRNELEGRELNNSDSANTSSAHIRPGRSAGKL